MIQFNFLLAAGAFLFSSFSAYAKTEIVCCGVGEYNYNVRTLNNRITVLETEGYKVTASAPAISSTSYVSTYSTQVQHTACVTLTYEKLLIANAK